MSTESKLQEALRSGQTVTITIANDKPITEDETLQQLTGRIVLTNSPDVVEFEPLHGAPVPIPVTRILTIE